MAPNRPQRITGSVTIPMCIMPLPMVDATAVPNPKAAMKLKNAAHSTAYFGDSTRVETTVAMELAASWKPLVKSNTRANTTIRATRSAEAVTGSRSGVLDDDGFQHIGHVFAAVNGAFQNLQQLFLLNQRDRVAFGFE